VVGHDDAQGLIKETLDSDELQFQEQESDDDDFFAMPMDRTDMRYNDTEARLMQL